MDKDYIQQKIKDLACTGVVGSLTAKTGWYQEFDLDGVKTHEGNDLANQHVSDALLSILPKNLNNTRILDIGANAGLHSVNCAIHGASVVSIEKHPDFFAQSKFIKEFYEWKLNKRLNWQIRRMNCLTPKILNLGRFDAIICIGEIPFFGGRKLRMNEEWENIRKLFVKRMCRMSDLIIVSHGESREIAPLHTDWYMNYLFNKLHHYGVYKEVETKKLTLTAYRAARG